MSFNVKQGLCNKSCQRTIGEQASFMIRLEEFLAEHFQMFRQIRSFFMFNFLSYTVNYAHLLHVANGNLPLESM